MKNVLTIAGSDPSGGAGLQADLKVFRDLRVRGLSVITALTAQSSTEVKALLPVSSVFVRKQLDAVALECEIHAVKIGMLARGAIVGAVAGFLKRGDYGPVVLDPVFYSTGGVPLLDPAGIERVRRLLPLVTVVTPNLDEASKLCKRPVRTVKDMKEAAQRLHAMGASNVVIKGGHLKKSAVDILYDGANFVYFEGRRMKAEKKKFHGTGCKFSSAIAATLAKGRGMEKAVEEAKKYVLKSVSAE